MYIPDPIELMDSSIEHAIDRQQEVGEGCCMECGKHVDYELISYSSDPAAWVVCYECLSPDQQKEYDKWMKGQSDISCK